MYITISTGFASNPAEPIFEQIDKLRESTFSSFELHGFPEHIDIRDEQVLGRLVRMGRDNGWRFVSIHAPAWGGGGRYDLSNPDADLRNESLDWHRAALNAARFIGAEYVVVHAGEDVKDEHQRQSRLELSTQSLLKLIPLAEKLEIIIALENVLPPYLTGSLEETKYIIETVNSPWVQPVFDVAHAFLTDDLEDWFRFFASHPCIAVHATDNHGRVRGVRDDDEHLFPGEGIIPWPDVLARMRRLGFDGPVTIECPINPALLPRFTDMVNGQITSEEK